MKTAAKLCDLDVIPFLFFSSRPTDSFPSVLFSLSFGVGVGGGAAMRGEWATFDARYLAHRKHFEERRLRRHAKPPLPFPSPLRSAPFPLHYILT